MILKKSECRVIIYQKYTIYSKRKLSILFKAVDNKAYVG